MLNAAGMVSLDEEIAIQNKIRAGMSQQEQMMKVKGFCARARARVDKGGETPRQLQSKVRDLIFSPAMSPEDEALALENAWVTSTSIWNVFRDHGIAVKTGNMDYLRS